MKQKILNFIIPLLAYLTVKGLNNTLKIKVIGEEKVKQLKQEGKRLIYAFWHGRQFLLVPYMANRQIVGMVSLSRDGEYHSRILKRFGYRIYRGSYTRGGVRGLLGLIRDMHRGYDVGFAIDGPTGPIYEPKKGIIFLAKKEKAYIVPLTSSTKKKWILEKAWDKFQIPHPFTQGIIIFGEPYPVSNDNDTREEKVPPASLLAEQECEKLKERLNAMTKEADDFWV